MDVITAKKTADAVIKTLSNSGNHTRELHSDAVSGVHIISQKIRNRVEDPLEMP